MARQFLSEFRLVDEEVISGYVNNLCTKSCALDPIPSSVFQRCQYRLVPIITRIVNLSFQGDPSSETQGQIKGARESLNGRKNMARRKVKNGNLKTCVFLAPIRSQNGGDRLELVW